MYQGFSQKNFVVGEAAYRKVIWEGSCKLAFGNIIGPNRSNPQQLAFLGGKIFLPPHPPLDETMSMKGTEVQTFNLCVTIEKSKRFTDSWFAYCVIKNKK